MYQRLERERRKGGWKKVDGWRKRSEVGRPSMMERLRVFMNRSGWLLQSAVPQHFLPPVGHFLFLCDQRKGHKITIHHNMLI